jgi:hypothetical protein
MSSRSTSPVVSLNYHTFRCSCLTNPGSEGVDPVATIKNVKPSTTEFRVACPTNVDSTNCGWGPGLDYTVISNTHYQAQMSYASVSMSFACDHNTQASEMTCTIAMTGGNMDTASPQTAVLKGNELSFNTATIVEGASLLKEASGSAGAQATPAASAGSGLMTAASASPTASGTHASGSVSGSAAPAQHTGAATRFGLEASVLLALAGAVVANVL